MGIEQNPEGRQSRLLMWILRFVILFSVVTLLVILIFDPNHEPSLRQYEILISGVIVFHTITYILNCVGYYTFSAILLVSSALIAPWLCLFFDPAILRGDFVPLTYLTFSILLSSILLPTYITIIFAIIQITGLILVLIISPATPSFNWFSFLDYVVLTSVFSILANSIIQGNMKQIESQTRQLALNEARLQELSIRDYLTHLFNRRYLEETLEREIQRATRLQHPLAIIMLDVDQFKQINDSFGHPAGDNVLIELSKFFAEQVRPYDIVCRYGGDEFVLILPDTSREVIKGRAEYLREKVMSLTIPNENPITITISVGVAIFPDNGSNGEMILKSADIALYKAKHNGGNCVVMAD
jgi:diguanylate cyclase (GGDEF)-like protein